MLNTSKKLVCKAALAVSLTFGALGLQAAPIVAGTFLADAVEDFEGTPGGRAFLTSLFGGSVSVVPGTVQLASVAQGNWTDFRSSSPIVPSSGSLFGAGFGDGTYSLDFSGLGGIFGFSGWFSAAGVGAESIEFFGAGNESLGLVSRPSGFGPGDGTMEFISITSDTAIQTLLISGQEITSDDLAYTTSRVDAAPVPVPGTLLLMGLGLFGLGFTARRRKA
ncbi:MAG TPA: PEP-CTERM sorting domain-containing protein [Halieaceae bacterium]|jgi:hypothetical protein|uniref:PEP-CTERM sorting domain-containing protein n=1 Tax=Haliea salexigens TaxID=287487 RepID=UPI00041A95AD|nr:PEP-CTERM sorting domain-containing protein [Haliea salexigens]HBM84625.1 PEP-CTERM sorting domain-containing protein [Halieaceae bacterium]|tara:strand:+ start:51892 stop:52554 length:663 start_codon:yes stop_codon:yes gene_type:complete